MSARFDAYQPECREDRDAREGALWRELTAPLDGDAEAIDAQSDEAEETL